MIVDNILVFMLDFSSFFAIQFLHFCGYYIVTVYATSGPIISSPDLVYPMCETQYLKQSLNQLISHT